MEKVIYALWRDAGIERESFNFRLLSELPQALHAAGATGIRINLRDRNVDPGKDMIQTWQVPQQDAVVQFWLPSANAIFRGPADAVIALHAARFSAWLVAESTIIANRDHPPHAGKRTWGWSQASFISFQPNQPWEQSLAHWHSHHTRVAIDTQSNFEYVQNVIIRPLTPEAPAYDAFVEECFPVEALSDPAAFFDAVDDQAKFAANTKTMMESCAAFIDFTRIDIIPTSQFDFASHD